MSATPASRYIFGTLPWYSVLIVTGIILALCIAVREEKRLRLPEDTTVSLALYIIPMGIIGARLYYVAFSWDVFRHDLLSILRIWEGGLAIYGGIIGGFLGGMIYALRHKLPVSKLVDMVAPALPLAQAVGRWGNYFNQEAYGAPITDSVWQFFPAGVLVGGQWYMATFFYESMWNLLVFVLLMAARRRMRRSGDVFLWYMALYGAGRMVIEGLRSDSLMTGSLRISQVLSLLLCAAAAMCFLYRALRQKHTASLMLLPFCAAGLALLWFQLPIPAVLCHTLLSLTLLIAALIAYLPIKPSCTEDSLCPPHPSKT